MCEDNQHVNRGDLIAEIDARDYEARAAEARARLADISARADGAQSNLLLTSTVTDAVLTQTGAAAGAAREQVQILQARAAEDAAAIRAAEAAMGQAEAQQSAAQAEASRAADDAVRYRALYAKDEVSKQQLDRAETLARSTAAAQEAASQATEAAKAHLAQARAAQVSTQAALRQAEKQVVQAQGRVSEAKSAPQQIASAPCRCLLPSRAGRTAARRRASKRNWLSPTPGSTHPNRGTSRASRLNRATSCNPASRCWRSCRIGSGWSPTSKKLN